MRRPAQTPDTAQFGEAEREARKAVKIDGTYGRGHYVLGHILGLYAQYAVDEEIRKAARVEALTHLRISLEEMPTAGVLIQKLE
ncbi:MAG: hypothetical protein ABIZ80_00900 [Bryobacteraceae bacterium]